MKPILFNTEMVQAILEGSKTQTRRVIQGVKDENYIAEKHGDVWWFRYAWEKDGAIRAVIKPKYKVGDILYVRETWTLFGEPKFIYKADDDGAAVKCRIKWRPSIHMPKEAARLFLRVTNVRTERLQDISEEDAMAEGAEYYSPKIHTGQGRGAWKATMAKTKFCALWNTTVKPTDLDLYGWGVNPWVWVYEFESISKDEATK